MVPCADFQFQSKSLQKRKKQFDSRLEKSPPIRPGIFLYIHLYILGRVHIGIRQSGDMQQIKLTLKTFLTEKEF